MAKAGLVRLRHSRDTLADTGPFTRGNRKTGFRMKPTKRGTIPVPMTKQEAVLAARWLLGYQPRTTLMTHSPVYVDQQLSLAKRLGSLLQKAARRRRGSSCEAFDIRIDRELVEWYANNAIFAPYVLLNHLPAGRNFWNAARRRRGRPQLYQKAVTARIENKAPDDMRPRWDGHWKRRLKARRNRTNQVAASGSILGGAGVWKPVEPL